tara:strand:- start:10745 stop:12274 length:1530 start_codon:yes stop_codon:yes gene_type:complete
MAKNSLDGLLAEVIEKVKETSQAYRNLTSDKKIHSIEVYSNEISKQVQQEFIALIGSVMPITPKVVEKINVEAVKFTQKMYAAVQNYNSKKKHSTVSGLKLEPDQGPASFSFALQAKENKTPNIFNAFKTIKQENQIDFNKNLIELLKGILSAKDFKKKFLQTKRKKDSSKNAAGKTKTQFDKAQLGKVFYDPAGAPGWEPKHAKGSLRNRTAAEKGFLDIGHKGGSSVSAQRLAAATAAIMGFEASTLMTGSKARTELEAAIKAAFKDLNWSIQKHDKTGDITVMLESKSINRMNQDEVLSLNKTITDVVETLKVKFVETDGSDSGITMRQKLVLKGFSDILRGKKGVKLLGFDDKLKPSHKKKIPRSAGQRAKPGKGASLGSVGSKLSKPKKYTQKREPASATTPNLGAILGILQDKLPQTVAKNMGSPRLNNRTGRFAGSVEVTDIAVTAKGFPSIGYTYMKRPYQTFEAGGAQGSADRDPRTLIDGSIREIAAGLAMGRFYTRRV